MPYVHQAESDNKEELLSAKNEELDMIKEEVADLKFQILEKDFNMSMDRMRADMDMDSSSSSTGMQY